MAKKSMRPNSPEARAYEREQRKSPLRRIIEEKAENFLAGVGNAVASVAPDVGNVIGWSLKQYGRMWLKIPFVMAFCSAMLAVDARETKEQKVEEAGPRYAACMQKIPGIEQGDGLLFSERLPWSDVPSADVVTERKKMAISHTSAVCEKKYNDKTTEWMSDKEIFLWLTALSQFGFGCTERAFKRKVADIFSSVSEDDKEGRPLHVSKALNPYWLKSAAEAVAMTAVVGAGTYVLGPMEYKMDAALHKSCVQSARAITPESTIGLFERASSVPPEERAERQKIAIREAFASCGPEPHVGQFSDLVIRIEGILNRPAPPPVSRP